MCQTTNQTISMAMFNSYDSLPEGKGRDERIGMPKYSWAKTTEI